MLNSGIKSIFVNLKFLEMFVMQADAGNFFQGTPLTPFLEHTGSETPWFVAGVVDARKRHSFERVLWRACRRTAFVRTAEIDDTFEDPKSVNKVDYCDVFCKFQGTPDAKAVFIVFFNGQKLHEIVSRVCEGQANLKLL